MKTSDEVKKSLDAHCRPFSCDECSYEKIIFCRDHLMKDAHALIQQLEAQVPKWISVKERLPEARGKQFLCLCQYENYVQAPACTMLLHWEGIGNNGYVDRPHFSNEGFCGMYVTHWMPLPEPPKEE